MSNSMIAETAQRFRQEPSAGRTAPSVSAVFENGRARL